MIDLGGWMLLRFDAEHGALRSHWLAASRVQHGAAWHALRTAVYARTGALNLPAPPQR
jgi:hypothetical protein